MNSMFITFQENSFDKMSAGKTGGTNGAKSRAS